MTFHDFFAKMSIVYSMDIFRFLINRFLRGEKMNKKFKIQDLTPLIAVLMVAGTSWQKENE